MTYYSPKNIILNAEELDLLNEDQSGGFQSISDIEQDISNKEHRKSEYLFKHS